MNFSRNNDWLVPIGLIALGLIPMAVGSFRLLQFVGGAAITAESARFVAAPFPVTLHIISAVVFCILGAFQFAPSFRLQMPNWHRVAGRIVAPCGVITALSGLWMTQFYTAANFDGLIQYVIRLLVGSAMFLFLCLGIAAIFRHDVACHRVWMIRGYALGIGAGTQVLTHLPWFLFPSIQGESARALFMGAGWFINLMVAEWLISRQRKS